MSTECDDDGMAAPEPDDHRTQGRAWSYELQNQARARGEPLGWFEPLYQRASGDSSYIPWEMAAPRFKLTEWLAANGVHGDSAVDVGCGLGDNAAVLADAGYDVTAFDLSETAIGWARERVAAGRSIAFHVANLFNLPGHWRGAFDLVHETYTLQALPQNMVEPAIGAIASLVRPGGRLLMMCRGRDEHEQADGPPWPLTKTQLEPFLKAGLTLAEFEEFNDQREDPIRHFLAVYRR